MTTTRIGLRCLGIALAILCQAPPLCPQSPAPADGYELYYRVSASVRGLTADADLEAEARLGMRRGDDMSGGATLTLVEPLAPAWKFYWIDATGPFGAESKLAAVVTLPEASWEALAAARAQVANRGEAAHAAWRSRSFKDHPFDGSFAFVVIGPATGRFVARFDAGGRLLAVENHLTDRWLNGPFDRFIGAWDTRSGAGDTPRGYWFWNDGEDEPFDWEPHVYHALEAALQFLALPMPESPSATVEAAADWAEAPVLAQRVVATLTPRLASRMTGDRKAELEIELDAGRDGLALLRAEDPARGLLVRRFQQHTSSGIVRDRVELRLTRRGTDLELEVGYRPL